MDVTTAVLQNIKNRRSVRKYKAEQVPKEMLATIVEAGRFAPSGHNNQTCHYFVIQKAEVLEKLNHLVKEALTQMQAGGTDAKPSALAQMAGQSGYAFYYHAPTLIVVANRVGYVNAMADCSVALENMMLAASALGLGSCWINQLRTLGNSSEISAYLRELGLGEEETVCGALAIGYSAQSEAAPLERFGNPITYID